MSTSTSKPINPRTCPPVGLRVCFRPPSVAVAKQYKGASRPGDCGVVATMRTSRKSTTCMRAPTGGGIVYVHWDKPSYPVVGVFREHLVHEKSGVALAGGRRRKR